MERHRAGGEAGGDHARVRQVGAERASQEAHTDTEDGGEEGGEHGGNGTEGSSAPR